ncbi:MAG: T9SS type A sorting domain-containing protein [Ignavibacteriaceae bacterium]
MKKIIFILSVLLSVSTLSQDGIIKKVYTNKNIYTYGETVYITLRAINTSSVPDTIIFPDLCEAFPFIDDTSYLVTFGIGCPLAVSFREIPAQDSIEWVIEYPNSFHPELLMPIGQHNIFGHFQQITFDPHSFFTENTDTIGILIEGNPNSVTDEFYKYNYFLAQNYPNPFNPRTIINYSLYKDGNVVLKVFDCLGNEVISLINEFQKQGTYSIVFDASDVSSGFYFYQLIVNDFLTTKKMVLIK